VNGEQRLTGVSGWIAVLASFTSSRRGRKKMKKRQGFIFPAGVAVAPSVGLLPVPCAAILPRAEA
jgi:hypothetical protein